MNIAWKTWTTRLLVVVALLIGINIYAWSAHHFIFDRTSQQHAIYDGKHAIYDEKGIRDALYFSMACRRDGMVSCTLEGEDVVIVTERRAAFEYAVPFPAREPNLDVHDDGFEEGTPVTFPASY